MDTRLSKTMATRLIEAGIALTSIQDLDELLEFIVGEARELTHADGGSLYIVEESKLDFLVCQSDTLTEKHGADAERQLFTPFTIPVSEDSLAGYVALKGETLNFPDVYELPEGSPFSFNRDFDERNDYRTESVLTLPMKAPEGAVVGVLQLINAKDPDGNVIPFPEGTVVVVQALASQAAVAVRNARLTAALRLAKLDTIFRLAVAAEYRDQDTARHIQRISEYCAVLARNMGMSPEEVELVEQASPMHDVGKLGVADAILLKPGRLTPEEFKEMEKHTIYGGKILGGSEAKILQVSESIALTHHEKWDGSGYPCGLRGESIPIEGRIVAVADVFDALSNPRCYKPAFPMEKVLTILREDSGTHFDARVTKVFFDSLDELLPIYERLREKDPEGPEPPK
jgi:HD-GYP domain-containing protein (c-di-GMP phosphodiesterase class II)